MELMYQGKTKDLYQLEDGHYQLKFKDDVTGTEGVFDPGANQVGLTLEGSGRANVRMSQYFFERFEEAGIHTHYLDADVDEQTMTVTRADFFGQGLEVICRYKAVGSFMRRYGQYAQEGQDLNGYVEITLKDDERQDPLITQEGLLVLGILRPGEYEDIVQATQNISEMIRQDLSDKGLELYDLKLEFGRDPQTGELMLIDEVSAGNMRVYKEGHSVEPLELANYYQEET